MNESTSTLAEKILQSLRNKPGQKARDLSNSMKVERSKINSILHGLLRGKVIEDKNYRWWPKDETQPKPQPDAKVTKLDTPLAKLSRYYLDCLNYDDQGGVSVFASGKFGLDYTELRSLPFFIEEPESLLDAEEVRRLISKIRRDKSRLSLVLGYPVCLTKIRSKKGWEGFLVEPVLIFPFQQDHSNQFSMPSFSDELPQINYKAMRSLMGSDSTSLVEEVVQLSEELGFATTDADAPELDEITLRLKEVRPEWNWREEPDPLNISSGQPLSDIEIPGIYNRAVLMVVERSPFTKGLETELSNLQSISEDRYKDTALGAWLRNETFESQSFENQPLLEVLPLNSEQRQAVHQSLNNALTVITGPPGTGKSQVVTSILINAAWMGRKVLFASKNNKAVDVVETRVNALGPRPILLRLGGDLYQGKLAEYLVSLLAASTSPEDEENYQFQVKIHAQIQERFKNLNIELEKLISLRNQVDRLEQEVESIRAEIGDTLFGSFRDVEFQEVQAQVKVFQAAIMQADINMQNIFIRSLWFLFKHKRYRFLQQALNEFLPIAAQIGVELPEELPNDEIISYWCSIPQVLDERIIYIEKVQEYFQALKLLTDKKPLELISYDVLGLTEQLSETSELLWKIWLRLQPKRMTQQDRRLLGEYAALLELIAKSNETGRQLGSQVFKQYHKLFPQITNILSCWAVTSLSARGRIPFEPEFFDLLVIDEASQCDIASALPLLFRAKRAVIIGDPKQLRHISTLSENQDRQLLAKHELVESSAGWAYSVRSLFDLASGLCRSEDIVALRDHHRSHADIIEFSNQHFYEGRLRVATNYERLRFSEPRGPIVRWVEVRGRVERPAGGGALNREEAKAIMRELERLVLRQNYKGSIGVVSPFRAQANLIRDLVSQQTELSAKLSIQDFLADTVHKFQGDERDLMFFSPVVSLDTPDGAFRFLKNNANLFNVAITRARGALVVVGDSHAALNSQVNYLARFAEYINKLGFQPSKEEATKIALGPEYPPVSRPELVSDWEKHLYRALYFAGFRPIPQYEVEKYTLDFAIFDGDRKLNIEVDGERYHRNWDGELCRRDQIRNQRLIELGWDIIRFWVYQVRDDLEGCLNRVNLWFHENLP